MSDCTCDYEPEFIVDEWLGDRECRVVDAEGTLVAKCPNQKTAALVAEALNRMSKAKHTACVQHSDWSAIGALANRRCRGARKVMSKKTVPEIVNHHTDALVAELAANGHAPAAYVLVIDLGDKAHVCVGLRDTPGTEADALKARREAITDAIHDLHVAFEQEPS